MKRTHHILALLLALLLLPAIPALGAGRADIRFETTTHDFGVISEKKGPVSCRFEFVNVGDGNLVITDATAQCGCTRPEYPETPVRPGKKGSIKVTFNPAGRPGAFTKSVTVRLAGDRKKKVVLKIKGTVQP